MSSTILSPEVPPSKLHKYWNLIWYKTKAGIQAECSQTYFGFLWWFFEPLLFLGIYYIIFGLVLKSRTEHFLEFLFVGLVTWRWYHSCTIRACRSIAAEGSLMQQVFVSKMLFPVCSMLEDTFKFSIVFLCLLVATMCFKFWPNVHWFALIPTLLTEFILIIGVGNFLASITPFVPDFPMVIENCLRGFMFLSGVFFDISNVKGKLGFALKLNPVADLLTNFRQILIDNRWPDFKLMAWALFVAIIFNVIGYAIIRRNERVYPKVCL